MKGIINIDRTVLEAILLDIDTNISFIYTGSTTTYSHIIEHPTTGEFALIIDAEDIDMMQVEYPEQLTAINRNLIALIVDLPTDWVTELESGDGELEDPETAFPNT